MIEGLDTQGHCPECGKPIAESLPERRIGTPWQQSPVQEAPSSGAASAEGVPTREIDQGGPTGFG